MTRGFSGGRSHAIAGVFVFLLLGVFAVFSTLLVLFGAQAYRATTARTDAHSQDRTMTAYVRNSLRGDDAVDGIEVRSEAGMDVLAVTYDYDGEKFVKRIYCYDGCLRELLTAQEYEFEPETGEEICPAESLRARFDGGMMTVEIAGEDGTLHTVETVLRTGMR